MRILAREHPNQTKEVVKIADSVLLSLLMRDNEMCNTSQASSTDLISGIKFSTLEILESLIPKDQKNITTLR